jgi:hypothetical protein
MVGVAVLMAEKRRKDGRAGQSRRQTSYPAFVPNPSLPVGVVSIWNNLRSHRSRSHDVSLFDSGRHKKARHTSPHTSKRA